MPHLWILSLWIQFASDFTPPQPEVSDLLSMAISLGGQEPPLPAQKPKADTKPEAQEKNFDGITVQYNSYEQDVPTGTATFTDGVVASYDGTVIHCQRLILHLPEQRAEAIGSVEVDDPAGILTADNINFSWKKDARTGHAENAVIHIANVTLKAKKVDLTPDKWDLYDVVGTNCREMPPIYEVHSKHLEVRPGRDAKIRKPVLWLFGRPILPLPDQTVAVDPRTQGFQYPSIVYHREDGKVGVSFKSGFLLGPVTNLQVSYGAIDGSRPGYSAVVTRSLLPKAEDSPISTPDSDFSERFRFGYFDNIQVRTPEQEARFLSTPRRSISFDTSWNSFVSDRPERLPFTKPAEVVYEVGGPAGPVNFDTQVRFQTIQEYKQDFHERAILNGSVGPPAIKLRKDLLLLGRLDSEFFAGNSYGWVRGSAGLAWEPVKQVTLSSSYFTSQDFGNPLFVIDPLFAKRGYVGRADFNLGPTKFSYMIKYDPALGWFDREYTISQVVGCIEPYLISRERPRSYNLGFRLRLDDFYDVLRHRNFKRPAPVGDTVISPTPNGKP